jgi:uncharacterized FAD-dependent dehydrogenase
MQKQLTLKLLPQEAASEQIIKRYIAAAESIPVADITGFHVLKHSIDARGKKPWISLLLNAFIKEPFQKREMRSFSFQQVLHSKKQVIIVGGGPAGLFAALLLIEKGIKPILLERGKEVRARRRDLAILNKEGIINPESNYCFGEGGAGTFSDGKLYTRSTKRGDITRILNLFVHFGADESILYESHPHIGTNKLPAIITAMRNKIEECGAEFLFEKKVVDFTINNNEIKGVKTADGDLFTADAVILATGHSARDIFELLVAKKILIEAKPFALGVRVEHPQSLVDRLQYHCPTRGEYLPAAAYSLVQQVDGKGVFSFCMCPGGIIAAAGTSEGELVVNGWSPSKRNNPYANSGIVVSVDEKDVIESINNEEPARPAGGLIINNSDNSLLLLKFQRSVESIAFIAGGGKFVAPAQRLVDFVENKVSSSLPDCSYIPGLNSSSLKEVLPAFIHTRLQKAFKEFGKTMPGYYTNDAVIVACESRTSSPVRIPRDKETLQHLQIKGLYPCGEGAGYAGGIISAAMDGEAVAAQIAKTLA